jgi:hypothetical protein
MDNEIVEVYLYGYNTYVTSKWNTKEIVFCVQNANIIGDTTICGQNDLVNSNDIYSPSLFLVDQQEAVVSHPYNHHVRRRRRRQSFCPSNKSVVRVEDRWRVRKQTGKKKENINRQNRWDKKNDEEEKKYKGNKRTFFCFTSFFLFKVNVGNNAVKNLNPNAQLFSSSDFNNRTVLAGSTAPSGMFY